MTSHSEKLGCSEEQRITWEGLSLNLSTARATAGTSQPQTGPGAIGFPAQLPARTQISDAHVGTYLTQSKAHSWGYPHHKCHYKIHERQQTSPSDTANGRLPLSTIPEDTITITIHPLGDGPEEFILLQGLSYCFSSGGRTTTESHLKMLRVALTQLLPRTQALLAHGRHRHGCGGWEHIPWLGTHSMAGNTFQPSCCSCVGQPGRQENELAPAAGMGRD